MDKFEAIADERLQLADVVAGLDDAQLGAPSLCGAWTVREVVAHLVMPLVTPMPKFALAMVKARGNFDVANDKLSRQVASRQTDLVGILREKATSRFTPPGFGPEAPLTDILVHGQDIRRPLGLTRHFEPERLRAALDFASSAKAERGFTAKGRLAGLRLEAEDIDWSHGEGADVRGSGEAVLLAMAGRRAALGDLSGDGVEVLQTRI